ncbi:MAG: Eco57I restriction-modification methylase domain-containing protein [Halobacteriota archaeon]
MNQANIVDTLIKDIKERLTLDGKNRVFEEGKELSSEFMKEKAEPEAFTKEFLIDKILDALGLEKLPEKSFETPRGHRSVDYRVKSKERMFLVEAKPLNADLFEKGKDSGVNQIKGLFKLVEVKENYDFGVATDGLRWVFVDKAGEIVEDLRLEENFEKVKEFLVGKERVVSPKTEEEISKKFYDWYNALLHGGRYKDHENKLKTVSEADCLVSNVIGVKELDEKEQIAQVVMNRLIFIKFLQSKGVIKEDILKYLSEVREDELTPKLRQLFFGAMNTPEDDRFDIDERFKAVPYLNGSLFVHTEVERKNIDYKVKAEILKKVIEFLDSFKFVHKEQLGNESSIDPEILGYIFERAMTATDRKGTGAYYTPKPITKYISENTIYPCIIDKTNTILRTEKGYKETELIKDIEELFILPATTLKEIWDKIILKLRVLDNACGSGAFLLAAANILFVLNKKINDKIGAENPDTTLKIIILVNNLYGVDINPNGIEIAKLRLWLWLADSYEPGYIKPLPNIDYNLRVGNSLIGYVDLSEFKKAKLTLKDYLWDEEKDTLGTLLKQRSDLIRKYKRASGEEAKELKGNVQELDMKITNLLNVHLYREFREKKIKISKEEFLKLNPFHWGFEFYEVFDLAKPKEEREFDVVMGNPPYVRIQTLNKTDKKQVDYFNKSYESAVGNYDIYGLFVERSLSLTPKGLVGFIMPNKFFLTNYGEGLRRTISEKNALNAIVNFKDNQIFQGASTYTCLIFLKETSGSCKYSEITEIKDLSRDLITISENSEFDNANILVGSINSSLGHSPWVFSVGKSREITEKLMKVEKTLGDYTERIFQGVATSADKIYIVKILNEEQEVFEIFSEETQSNHKIEKDIVKILVKGKDVKKYFVEYKNRAIIFPYHRINGVFRPIEPDILSAKYPKCFAYFKQNEEKIKSRENGKLRNSNTWYEYTYPRSINLYEKSKILTPNSAFSASFYLDDKEHYYMTCGVAGGYGIKLKEGCPLNEKYLLVLLNSNLMDFYNKKIGTCLRGHFYSYEGRVIKRYPIVESEKNMQLQFIHLCNYMLFLNETEERRNTEKDLIEFIDKQVIDSLVYELYFKEKIEEDGLKTNLLGLIEPYLKDIENLETDEEKLKLIKEVVEKIRGDRNVKREIEKIKSHEWVKVIVKG